MLPDGVRTVLETGGTGPVPLYRHEEWARAFPWLVQGTTGRGDGEFDLALFGAGPAGAALARWRALREAVVMPRAVHSRQVHGREISRQAETTPGLLVLDGFDGHITDRPGILLTVSVADCVPISIVDPEARRVGLLHAGWRGTAAGILPRGLEVMGVDLRRVRVHLGPAICGRCYEVGPEVHAALGLPRPPTPRPVDLRAVLAEQAVGAGVAAPSITTSAHCTRCGSGFFSYRGGSAGRQMGILGVREEHPAG